MYSQDPPLFSVLSRVNVIHVSNSIHDPLYHYHPFQVWVSQVDYIYQVFWVFLHIWCIQCSLPLNRIFRESIILILFHERVWLRNSRYGIFSCALSFLCRRFYTSYSPFSSQETSIDVLVQSERPCFRNRKSSCTIISLCACILILTVQYRRGDDKRLCSGSC